MHSVTREVTYAAARKRDPRREKRHYDRPSSRGAEAMTLLLIWFGGNALVALVAIILGWLDRRAADRILYTRYPTVMYAPNDADRVIAEAFFAVPEFMKMVREEERGI